MQENLTGGTQKNLNSTDSLTTNGENRYFYPILKPSDMSLENTFTVNCPKCGHEQDVIVWSSLNVQLNPEAREDFQSGKINLFTCDACGTQAAMNVPFMYHDMERKFCVQFYPEDSINDDVIFGNYKQEKDSSNVVFSDSHMPEYEKKNMGYLLRQHIVFSMQEAYLYVRFMEKLHEHSKNK